MPTGPRPAPPPGTARVALSGKTQGHTWVNVFYLELTGSAITVNDLQTLANDIATNYHTNVLTPLSTSMTLTQVDIRYIPSAGNEVRFTGSYSYAGGDASSADADAGACYVISFVISDYYRGGHPRWYIPGMTASQVTNGSDISPTQMSGLVNDVNTFRSYVNGLTTTNITGVSMGTVRFQSGNAWLAPPRFVAFTSVKAGKNSKLGSQRRRILA